jgi:hypothetical protein
MNIEKIKNYNQTMLAVIVTAAVAFAIVGLFSFIFFMITEVFNFFPRNNSYNAESVLPEKNFNDEKQDPNKQYISYDFPELVDTALQLYIIPIRQRNEYQLDQYYSRKISFSKSASYSENESYNYSYNTFINLLIYDAKNGKTESLFKQKILISGYSTKYFKDDVFIVFEAAYSDTDKSGEITMRDQTSLFIYSLHNMLLKQVKYSGLSTLQIQFIGDTKDLIVRFGVDPADRYDKKSGADEIVLCKYDYERDELYKINDEKLHKNLQDFANKTN